MHQFRRRIAPEGRRQCCSQVLSRDADIVESVVIAFGEAPEFVAMRHCLGKFPQIPCERCDPFDNEGKSARQSRGR